MLAEHFIAFSNEYNTFYNKGSQMLDCIYHIALKLL